MRKQVFVSIGFAAALCAPAMAQSAIDSEAWLTAPASVENPGAVRWRITTESSSGTPVVIGSGQTGGDRVVNGERAEVDLALRQSRRRQWLRACPPQTLLRLQVHRSCLLCRRRHAH